LAESDVSKLMKNCAPAGFFMPIPRMTTRRWMIAVAVVGVPLAVGIPAWPAMMTANDGHGHSH